MGRSHFLPDLLLLAIFLLTISHGFARIVRETMAKQVHAAKLKEIGGVAREMIQLQDYKDPEPNYNSRSGLPVPRFHPRPHPHPPAPSPDT